MDIRCTNCLRCGKSKNVRIDATEYTECWTEGLAHFKNPMLADYSTSARPLYGKVLNHVKPFYTNASLGAKFGFTYLLSRMLGLERSPEERSATLNFAEGLWTVNYHLGKPIDSRARIIIADMFDFSETIPYTAREAIPNLRAVLTKQLDLLPTIWAGDLYRMSAVCPTTSLSQIHPTYTSIL